MAYMTAQGGTHVARDEQTVCVACCVANELNTCDEQVKKVVGILRLTSADLMLMKREPLNDVTWILRF